MGGRFSSGRGQSFRDGQRPAEVREQRGKAGGQSSTSARRHHLVRTGWTEAQWQAHLQQHQVSMGMHMESQREQGLLSGPPYMEYDDRNDSSGSSGVELEDEIYGHGTPLAPWDRLVAFDPAARVDEFEKPSSISEVHEGSEGYRVPYEKIKRFVDTLPTELIQALQSNLRIDLKPRINIIKGNRSLSRDDYVKLNMKCNDILNRKENKRRNKPIDPDDDEEEAYILTSSLTNAISAVRTDITRKYGIVFEAESHRKSSSTILPSHIEEIVKLLYCIERRHMEIVGETILWSTNKDFGTGSLPSRLAERRKRDKEEQKARRRMES